ncbi:MAG: T9SS type A sorting domain-containing protein [Bacteroidia bacterium]|nr:T9SS type A sorting domain-containing protein [Bacteroidia bacterium]
MFNNFSKVSHGMLMATLLGITSLNAQTVIYSENFNSGTPAFTLNASDMGSQTGGSNTWVINNVYDGGFFGGQTPTQPGGITGGPESKYMHIKSDMTDNASFNAGFSGVTGNVLTKMNTAVSTVGYTNVSLDFWTLCYGHASNTTRYYGKTFYSIDGGTTWVQNPTTYSQIDTWTKVAPITNPVFDNQPDLRFAFMWVQAGGGGAADPAFSIDEITIKGNSGSVTPTITTTFTAGASYCPGADIVVPFTSTGTFASGNTYKVELSDANGSFANPTAIGTLASNGNSGNVNATIPAGAANGTGYRVRVVSTDPVVNGSPNGTDFAIAPGQEIVVTSDPAGVNNLCGGSITLSIPNTYTGINWSPGGQTSNSIVVTAAGDYSVSANGTGGCPAQSAVISISAADAPTANFTYTQPSGYLIEFTNTSENGVTYLWNFGAATTTSVNPTFTFPFDGEYPVKLVVTNECGTDSITILVDVKKLVGINDLQANANLLIHPVPTQDVLNLDFTGATNENATINILNPTGQIVHSENCQLTASLKRTIQLGNLAQGLYLLSISSESGTITKKFIKN